MLASFPRHGAFKVEGIKPKRKAWEQAHMADHVLAKVSSVCSDLCFVASKAVRKRHLFRTCSTEVEPSTKVVKKVGADEQEPAAPAPALDSKDWGPSASLAGAVDH